jgi:hypothetical protein
MLLNHRRSGEISRCSFQYEDVRPLRSEMVRYRPLGCAHAGICGTVDTPVRQIQAKT